MISLRSPFSSFSTENLSSSSSIFTLQENNTHCDAELVREDLLVKVESDGSLSVSESDSEDHPAVFAALCRVPESLNKTVVTCEQCE